MRYDLEIGGRTREVTIERSGAGFIVTVDGRARQVDVARIDAHTLSLVLDSVHPKDVIVSGDLASGQLTVAIDGAPIPVVMNVRRRARAEAGAGGHRASGAERTSAPMPGKIVRVLVKPGDDVAARQPLAVIEAMKMENELRAGRGGRVAEVHVREGQSVDAGALLVVIQ